MTTEDKKNVPTFEETIAVFRQDEELFEKGAKMPVLIFPTLTIFAKPRGCDEVAEYRERLQADYRRLNIAKPMGRAAERTIEMMTFFDCGLVSIDGITKGNGFPDPQPIQTMRAAFLDKQPTDAAGKVTADIKMPGGEICPDGAAKMASVIEQTWRRHGDIDWAALNALGKSRSGSGSDGSEPDEAHEETSSEEAEPTPPSSENAESSPEKSTSSRPETTES